MVEYIERETALKGVYELLQSPFMNDPYSVIRSSRRDGALAVRDLVVKAQPAADVAPVRHSHWYEASGKTWCYSCKASNKNYKPPYCPHCGAKMDGGGQSE